MQKIEINAVERQIRERAAALMADGTIEQALGWRPGVLEYDLTPSTFGDAQDILYNSYCSVNLSKFMVTLGARLKGRTLVVLKPCDSYSMNQLLSDHRIDRSRVYALGVPCPGMKGADGQILEKCLVCEKTLPVGCDEVIEGEMDRPEPGDRFERVRALENMTAPERYEFWRGELSKCIRCNACRNACPACSCLKCVFDNPASGVASKANPTDFEENMFHIVRAFHVAGRCTDCGECSRACPQNIPLHLLNRKFIKDIDELYGEYQAGAEPEAKGPLTSFTKEDIEPGAALDRGGNRA